MAARKFLGDLIARYTGVGGATADASNPLSVRGPGALFDGNTGGHQIRVNKAAAGDTASFLFQDGFSGRAEFGLIGNDNFELKVSADGSSFSQAWVIDDSTAVTDFKQEPTYLGQGLWHTGDFQISDYMPLAGGAFTGNVSIETNASPAFVLATTETSGEQADVVLRGARTSLTATIATMTYQNNLSGNLTDAAQWIITGEGDVNLAVGTLKVQGNEVYHPGNAPLTIPAVTGDFIVTQTNGGVSNVIWWDGSASKLYLGTDGSGGGVIEPRAPIVTTQNAEFGQVKANTGVGVGGATPDATNRFSANTTAALFNNDGDDIRLTLNKAAEADDATLTFQDAFSTKAQMGLSGNDDFTIKVGSAFTTALVIDEDTGVVSMPETPTPKFTINKSGRFYLYAADDRWVTNSDDNYGPSYYQHNESGGTGANPIQEWEHMGEYVRKGTVVHELSMFGRATDLNAIADLEIYLGYTTPSAISRWDTTGVDNDGEDAHTELWRGFWKAGGTGVTAFTHNINDQHRHVFPINFTCPEDGQLRIYVKPVSVDPRPDTNNDYFIQSHSWLLSYA